MKDKYSKLYTRLNIAQVIDMVALIIYFIVCFCTKQDFLNKNVLVVFLGICIIAFITFIVTEDIKHEIDEKQYKEMLKNYIEQQNK